MIEKTFNKNVNKEQNACDTKPDTKIFCETKVLNLKNEKRNITIFGYKPSEIKWFNVIWLLLLHPAAVYGYIHGLLNPVRLWTVFFVSFLSQFSGLGMY